jgi:PAS domain S-box-containing protein
MNVTQFPAAYAYEQDVRFRALFEGAAIGIGICRLDGQILEANGALSRMLGYSQQELLRIHAEELWPDHRRRMDDECQIYSGTLSLDQRLLGELMRGERDCFETEKHYRRKDGSHLWGHLTVSLAHAERDQPAFLIAALADATERKRVEERLREAEKMEVMGRLVGGVAHDFNNLLTGILLYCDLLSAGLESSAMGRCGTQLPAQNHDESGELCQHVEEVRRAGEQGAAMTQQLLSIARKQIAEPRPVPINQIVASTENLLRQLIGEQIRLVLLLEPSLDATADSGGFVLADPAQMRQVLMNLVLNSRDAMPRGGTITVSTRPSRFPNELRDKVPDNLETLSPRHAISLTVADDGCGMDAATRSRIFEPFFTTKKPGAGTGLGLATVHRIVSEAGGMISVESAAGRGTRIEIFFPAVKESIRSSTS